MIPHSKPTIGNADIKAVVSVLKSGYLSSGVLSKRFEKGFAKYVGSRFAVAVNSGTSALHLALLALKIQPKDEVIIPSYVCTALLNAINYIGAVARVADIDSDDLNISPASVSKLICRKTKAVIVPHMFGLAAKMDELRKLRVPVIEDCALSLGATYKDKKIGSFGKVSVFSFYPTKMMTTGEGGMLVTNLRSIYNYAASLKDYDHKVSYRLRYNYKMSDLQAGLGLAQLARLDSFISHRQRTARMYNKRLKDLNLILPYPSKDRTHTYFRYVIRSVFSADCLIRRLEREGIAAKKAVFRPIHQYLGLNKKNFPVTEAVYRSSVSLPIYPSLKEGEAKAIISKVRKVLSS